MERRSWTSPLHSPPCPGASPNSRSFVLPHSHGLIVVLLNILHESCRLCLPFCFRSCIFEGCLKRKKEKSEFSSSSSLLSKCRPRQWIVCFVTLPQLLVVLLHVLMNNDDGRRPKAPTPPVGARGRHHGNCLHRSWTGMLQRVYRPNQPLLHPFLQHLLRALTHLRQWQ